MKIYIKDIKGLELPKRATENDAGYDVVATTFPQITGESIERPFDGLKIWRRVAFIEYGTNIYAAPEELDKHIEAFPRSSASKYNLVLANSVGTIDNGYRGQINIRFKYIFQPEDMIVLPEADGNKCYGIVNPDYIYQKGDKICQLKGRNNCPLEFELVQVLPESQRGTGGFGSSGV